MQAPASACVVTDFDGTLSPIVDDPARARPLPGAAAVLTRLARVFGCMAVVSGRPVSFLLGQLGPLDPDAPLRLVGLYGLEGAEPPDRVVVAPEAEQWRRVVAKAADRADGEAPEGVTIERKGLSVTLHWRGSPRSEDWARRFADRVATEDGLAPHPAKMSIELRPPLEVDKGTAVAGLASGFRTACFIGDDLGDLPAFAALDRLVAEGRLSAAAKVAVGGDETPPEMLEAADLTVAGPEEALALLAGLADAVS